MVTRVRTPVAVLSRRPVRIIAGAVFGGMLALLVALGTPQHASSARASTPSAIELADRLLSASLAVEDEGPYSLIDPVGPGGLTQKAATSEVLASTMQGGIYGDHQYYGQYGEQIYLPPAAPAGGYIPHPHGWGGPR